MPTLSPTDLTALLRDQARDLGFVACGITDAAPLDCGPLLGDWVAGQRHASMDYLARPATERCDPRSLFAAARSVAVLAWPYPLRAAPAVDWRRELRGRVAAYALGRDYHEVLEERLRVLATRLEQSSGARSFVHVDGGPLVEKHLARRAGLGWYGRNTNLLAKRGGSSFVLGCLLTEAALVADPPFAGDHCGDCRACVPACPTGALDDGPTIDASRCISYLTIEHRGPIDPGLRGDIGSWVFGCDDCQDVCPWNDAGSEPVERQWPWLPGLLFLTEREFRDRFRRTALLRAKRRGLARNAAVVLANTANPEATPWLARALRDHDEPLVRAHAAWGLGRLDASGAPPELRRALRTERVPPVRFEIERALQL